MQIALITWETKTSIVSRAIFARERRRGPDMADKPGQVRCVQAEVLVDIDHFKAGQTVIGQMDKLQHTASRHVLVITADYVASAYCRH